MATNAGAGTSDFRKAEHSANEAGGVIAERASEAAQEIGRSANEAMRSAGSAMTRVREKGGQAVTQAADVAGNFRRAIETSARSQPGTTVAMAVAAGFLFGLLWRSGNSPSSWQGWQDR